jgi:uncharacterized membrane protein YccC
MMILDRLREDDLLGVHLAANIFVGTTLLWVLLRGAADLDPIWAITSLIAASDPHVDQALKTFRGRIINALLGCSVGLLFVAVGSSGEWKLPFAMSAAVLLSSYVVRVEVMWRQAPITAAIVIAGGLSHHSKLTGVEAGLERVGEVMLGCVIGVLVSVFMSKIWHVPEASAKQGAPKP